MKFKEYNDYYLIYLIREMHCEVSLNLMFKKYEVFIRKKINSFRINRIDYDDYLQEGMIVLNKAVNHYDNMFKKTFFAYFDVLLTRRYITLKNTDLRKIQYDLVENLNVADEREDLLNEAVDVYIIRDYYMQLNIPIEKMIFMDYFVEEINVSRICEKYNINRKRAYNIINNIKVKIKQKLK